MTSKEATNPTANRKNADGAATRGRHGADERPLNAVADSSSDNSATKAAVSPPQQSAPSWARYINSRLKQFSLR